MRYYFILIFILISFKKVFCQKNEYIFLAKNDSIQIYLAKKYQPSATYYLWNNICIPKPYQIIDSIRLKKNASNLYDLILVLGVKNKDSAMNSDSEYVHSRLLVFIKKKTIGYKLISVNSNVIPAVDEYANESFQGIQEDDNNIILKFETGTSRKCEYRFWFKKYGGRFILSQLLLECYLIDLSKQQNKNIKYGYMSKRDITVLNLRKIIEKYNSNINL